MSGGGLPNSGQILGATPAGMVWNEYTRPGREAAEAQGRMAEAQLAEQRETRRLATAAAEPTPQEMQQIERSIALNEQEITRKQRLIDSSDPALIEAGQQALKLLQGAEAKTLDPIRKQREKERAKLQDRLKSKLGSGYETSTAGIQALSSFDEATANTIAGAQQQSLAQLLGVAQSTSAGYGMQNNIANSGTLAGMYANQSNRRVAAISGTPVTAAGAQFVGDLQAARAEQGNYNTLANMGVQAGMAYATGGASTIFPAAGGAGGGGGMSPTAGGPGGMGSYQYGNMSAGYDWNK